MFRLFLFLHIAGAIVAFGPSFALTILGIMGGKEPAHVNFALRAMHRISTRIILPVAVSMLVTGLGLVEFGGVSLTRPWLLAAIAVYLSALAVSFGVMQPNTRRMIALTSSPPDAGGPPPELLQRVKRVRIGGMYLTLALAVILVLMVFKPGG